MKTKNIIIISTAAALFVTSTVVSCVLFLPRRLSGIIDINHATSISYHAMDGVFVLPEEHYQDFYEATKNIDYKVVYQDCLCRTPYDLFIEYPSSKVTTINGYYYYNEIDGENVGKAKSISFTKGTIEDLKSLFVLA